MPDTNGKDNGRTIQSLDRAAQLLRELASAPEGLSLGELGRRVGIAVQTAQGLLRTLQKHGYVTQSGRGAPYFLGSEPHRLSRMWLSMRTPPQAVRQEVSDLCSRLGEYVVLAEMRGVSWAPLLEYNSNQTLIVQGEGSSPSLLHTLATGQVLLAFMKPAEVETILAQLDFSVHGPAAIRSPERLRERIAQVAREGYAVCVEQRSSGIAAVAVPVRGGDANGLALGASIPMPRYSQERTPSIIADLRQSAERIEQLWNRSV